MVVGNRNFYCCREEIDSIIVDLEVHFINRATCPAQSLTLS